MYALPGLPVVAGPFIDTKLNYYSKRAPRQQRQARCEMVQGHLRRYVAQGCVQKLISDEGLAHGRLLAEADLQIKGL
jgi:hypothetical protein